MNKELIHDISESLIQLRFLAGTHFLKPIKEIERERSEFPPGYIHTMDWLMSRGNEPVSMTDLAGAMCISKPNLTTMVDRLYMEGLVERSADVSDRRVVNVALTEQGVTFLCRHKAEILEFLERRLSLLDDTELNKLKQALDDIADIIKGMGEKKMEAFDDSVRK